MVLRENNKKKPCYRKRVGRPYRLYPKASVRLPAAERKPFLRPDYNPITLWWRCCIERYCEC